MAVPSGKQGLFPPPLEVDPGTSGTKSNHRIAYVSALLPKIKAFDWQTYSYWYINEDSVRLFGDRLASVDWGPLLEMEGSNGKADLYQETETGAMERFFSIKRKSTDFPWINARIRKLIHVCILIHHRLLSERHMQSSLV